jgi:hypothetical protein
VFGNTYYSYEGQWSTGKMHGPGKFMMQDGGSFEGDFVKGEITVRIDSQVKHPKNWNFDA